VDSNNGRPWQVAAAVDECIFSMAPKADVPIRRRVLDRALPGPMIDLIRDGVHAAELKESGGRAVYKALWRTAASASQRGLDRWEWEEYVFQPQSHLGRQLRLRDGRTQLPPERVRKTLDNVWDHATAWVSEQEPPATRQELLLRARPSIAAARRKLEDPTIPLRDSDRAVLHFACSEIERRGLERVVLPWRAVCASTGLPERTVKNSLKRLVAGRHLMVVVPGRRGQGSTRRATIYRLVAPVPENGSMGPPDQFYGTPLKLVVGTPSVTARDAS
jgi:hypothetical protein